MQSTSLAGCSILTVEDELIALDIRSAFEKAGAVTLTARSFAVALRLVEHDDLSAAVLDFGLGDGDADALCVRLDQRHIPFILNSGYSQHGPACINGIVIPKPAEPATLVSAVAAFLHCGPQGDPNVHHRSADTGANLRSCRAQRVEEFPLMPPIGYVCIAPLAHTYHTKRNLD